MQELVTKTDIFPSKSTYFERQLTLPVGDVIYTRLANETI